MTDEEISMVLNTFMYLDYKEAEDGMTINEILKDLEDSFDCQEKGVHYGEYSVLSKAAENPEIGELIIGNQSHLLGYDTGTAACTFMEKNGSSVYVVYRGTGDGEWPDNGLGMTKKATLQQERALAYFEDVIERQQITREQKVIVTGHSKGGNKAQYVTMTTGYSYLLDACYNIDGQGFSEKAIEGFRTACGKEEYERRTRKITGVYGENDYVNVLGYSIVPKDRIHYVKTPVKKDNFAGYHDIKYMFASLEKNPVTGEWETVFHGRKNDYAMGRGELGNYAAVLSARIMALPSDKRDGCAASVMQLMELSGGRKTGLNGEKLSLWDMEDFLNTGMAAIAGSLFGTQQGRDLLEALFAKPAFVDEMTGMLEIRADYMAMARQIVVLDDMAGLLAEYKNQTEEILDKLPQFMKGSWGLCMKLKKEIKGLDKEIRQLKKLSEMLESIIKLYMIQDVNIAQELMEY